MKLIQEVLDSSVKITIEESKTEGKQHYIEGIFLQSGIVNRNGRMYPESLMDKEVSRYIDETISKNRAFGEMQHPDSPQISLERVSHLITSLKKEGLNYIGKAKILDTPMGRIAKGLLDGGASLGVSSRALGSLKPNNEGIQIVQDDFVLSTAADIVADPSGPSCFVKSVMENAEWIYDATSDSWKISEYIKEEIKKNTTKNLIENQVAYFRMFLNSIK